MADVEPGPGTAVDPDLDEVDVAVAAYREHGTWHVDDLADTALVDAPTLMRALRRFPSDDGAVALVSVGEDFLLLARSGARDRLLLSDASAATDWALARSAIDVLGVPVEDDDEPAPAGDLGLLADLGIPAAELGLLLDDDELYPDEQLSDIADRLGFGPEFDELAGLAPVP